MNTPDDAHHTHRYQVRCEWSGTTAVGYDAYDRTHIATVAPRAPFALSSDPAFHGDPQLMNPEQLLVLAAVSCQLLSFLAVAARARIDVVSYEDDGVGEMPENDKPVRIRSIVLRPKIHVAAGPTEARVRHLVEVAHRECYIANSLRTDIRIEPMIIIGSSGGA